MSCILKVILYPVVLLFAFASAIGKYVSVASKGYPNYCNGIKESVKEFIDYQKRVYKAN